MSTPQTLHLGMGVTPLVFVEVTPLRDNSETAAQGPAISVSSPRAKLILRRKTLRSLVSKHESAQMFRDSSDMNEAPRNATDAPSPLISGSLSFPTDESDLCWARLVKSDRVVPIVFLLSDNPAIIDPIPCWIVGYGYLQNSFSAEDRIEVIVTDSTLVRVLPVEEAYVGPDPRELIALSKVDQSVSNDWKSIMMGECCHPPLSAEMISQVLCNHDEETVRALSLRMSMLLAQPISVGTTADALALKRKHEHRKRAINGAIGSYIQSKDSAGDFPAAQSPDRSQNTSVTTSNTTKMTSNVPSSLREGALIVHSPNHGAGKTLLVRAIAQERLKCQAIHIIQPSSLLAKYGIHADAGLESFLHAIVISAACRQQSVCIILDNLDAMLSPVGRASAGDAAMPVLKAIGSYLKSLTLGLKRNHEFLFPTKSPLYNLAGTNGHVLSTKVCLVGIMTCEDGGSGTGEETLSNRLDMLVAGRYRLPTLSAKCRLAAFQNAFDRVSVKLSDEAMNRLPLLAASAVEARGRAFSDVAACLATLSAGKRDASLRDLTIALSTLKRGASSASKVEFTEKESVVVADKDVFSSVGGNMEAKQAIEEALAVDPEKRRILRSFGLSPPTGLLLYGPPGTGKTLLAKSVARLLRVHATTASSFGGSFVSLQASEIVRGEVGNSEKMIVSAFETARSNAPSVVFIDEFQALFTERGGSGSGKLTSTLLQCMDAVSRWRDSDEGSFNSSSQAESVVASSRVVVMGATNTPWMIDKAFLRPGRFDRVVHVSLPTIDERISILRVHISRMRMKPADDPNVERICKTLAETCDGFSGADLAALCRAAAVECLAEGGEGARIEERHFNEARKRFSRSCDVESAMRLMRWKP